MKIAELIAATKGPRSQRELASQGRMSVQNVQQWSDPAFPRTNFPDRATISKLARMCGVTDWIVVKAAAETLGIDTGVDGSKFVALLPPEAGNLTDEQIHHSASSSRAR
jgi:hypothetical protein